MPDAIGNLGIPPSLAAILSAPELQGSLGETGKPSFQNMLWKSLEQVNSLQQSAESAVEESLVGGDVSEVEAMTAVKKADLSLRMMLQIRNKLLEAYNEIQQMRF